jgi:glycosyl hydrolase family 26
MSQEGTARPVGNLEVEPRRSHPPMHTSPIGPRFSAVAARLRAPARLARPWRALIVAVLALATLVPPAPAPPAAAAGRANGPLVPDSGFYVGAYTKHIDGYGQQRAKEAMGDLESRLGRRLHINHHFYAWSDVFPSWREPYDIENDRIPMISWNGENTDAIARGDWDGLIAARAQAIAMLNTPVFIRWFWEMDGNKKQGFISSPASYQRAWRHIHDIFQQAGAINAVWVWCPNASAFEDGEAQPYYPGAGYVDWVCGDGYNFAPNRPGDKWESLAQIYNGFYANATRLGKPLMIGEFGALERKAGEKEQWFRQAHDWIAGHPAIAAVVYFNADSTTNGIYYDWRVDTSPSSFEGFRYLFTGPAPVRPSTMPDRTAPPVDAEPAPPVDATPTPATTPKPTKPRSNTPAPADGAVIDATTPAAPTSVPASNRAPSPRLTWVLELLRQLDAAFVAT